MSLTRPLPSLVLLALLLALAAQGRRRARGTEERRLEESVEPVEGDPGSRVDRAHTLGGPDREPQRGVHRHGEEDQSRGADAFLVERFHGEIERRRMETGALEESLGKGDARRLVPELVRRDEEDAHGVRYFFEGW